MSSFTDAEHEVLNSTVELVNRFCALPELHPADKDDFIFLIHRIQDMVLSRPYKRELTEVYYENSR